MSFAILRACEVCGAKSNKSRCPRHRRKPVQRNYRGLARYREIRAVVIARDLGICHICGGDGADAIDHHPIAYRDLPKDGEGEVPVAIALDPDNLRAAHHNPCNLRKGARDLDELYGGPKPPDDPFAGGRPIGGTLQDVDPDRPF